MEQLRIGWGREDITMEGPVSIPGQMHIRLSEGVIDPLYATALALDGGKGQDAVIFCALDLVATRGVMDRTVDYLRKIRPDIPADNIIINVTHNHSSLGPNESRTHTPDGQAILPGEQVAEFVKEKAAKAICTAWDNRRPGGIAYGYGYAVVAHSRRVCYLDDVSLRKPNETAPNGHAVMYGATNDPMFSHYEAGADHFLNAMFTFDSANNLTGIVCNVPCPSQLCEHFHKLTGDFWEDVRQGVRKEFGEKVYVLPQCAAAGDLSPRTLHYKEAQARRMHLKYDINYNMGDAVYAPELKGVATPAGYCSESLIRKAMAERKDIGERILAALKDIYSWSVKDIQTCLPVKHRLETVELSRRMITDEETEWCRENIEKMRNAIPTDGTPEELNFAQSRFNSIRGRNTRALERYATQNEQPTLPMRMHVVRLGEIAFCTERFELYMDFMHRTQARSPFIQTFVMQLAGEEGGNYLATQRGREGKGYSASLFCNMVSPEGGQEIVENWLRILNELNED